MDDKLTGNDGLNPFKAYTTARIGIGRVGTSIPLKESLQFKLAHAHARDAVYSTLDADSLIASLEAYKLPVLRLHSNATTRHQYLKRPDLGRRLNDASLTELKDYAGEYDVIIILVDGLSATGVNENTPGLLEHLIRLLTDSKYKIAPICLVDQGRVAIGDDIGGALNARFSIVLIGERPGLSSSDSLGAYLTYGPKPGLTDESRNCVSNIRPQGLNSKPAADKIYYLVIEAFKRKLTGVALKDNHGLIGQ
jgi:ethanolamine ammonia-lyase small subunit